ncbi:MAG: hypothetical protein PHD95_02570 [Candidatus ainarchaeum sp.]|nr:hypothetical protein [Candidatus ainarchaeum sp.]
MKKKFVFAFLIAILFFVCPAGAQYYTISSHSIDISIDEDGFALISEKFYLQFPNEFQLQDFLKKNAQIGISLDSWKTFDSRIHTYVGKESELNRAEVNFVDSTSGKYLEIKYSLNTPIADKKAETSRLIEFSLQNKAFDQFLQGGVLIMPENTTITVKLPNFAEIQSPVKPEGTISANQVTWQGYKSTNVLELNYVLVKQIASISLLDSANALVKSPLFILFVAAIAAIIIVAAIKRKKISEKIENFLVENSELGGKEEIEQQEEE